METSVTVCPIDRRQFRRLEGREHGIVAARVRLGYRVAVIDVSAGGALIETSKRLLPGAAVDLQVETVNDRRAIPGRVVRCAIARLRSNSVAYRAAIAFDRPWRVPFGGRANGYGVPSEGARHEDRERVDRTHETV
jgi:hypothetical protein